MFEENSGSQISVCHSALRTVALSLLYTLFLSGSLLSAQDASPTTHTLVLQGISDLSAAVLLPSGQLLVGDDETNLLRVYDPAGGVPLATVDVNDFLGILPQKKDELDLEAAAQVGSRVYWITSHGRNKDGKERPDRYRFFVTEVNTAPGSAPTIRPVGTPCKTFVQQLVKTPFAQPMGLDKATRLGEKLKKEERERLAPKVEGLNIEGMAASADGKTLYVGLRNPLPVDTDGRPKALVVTVLNAADVMDRGMAIQFGEPLLWDLDGLGIRSMEYAPAHRAILIVAGSTGAKAKKPFELFRWSGVPGEAPVRMPIAEKLPKKFTPESIAPALEGPRVLLLSDDGTRLVSVRGAQDCQEGALLPGDKCENKNLLDQNAKTCRGLWITPQIVP
ncbi:MAG TPA: DUF3616 domain-containing protein [Candidatus Sumerlaeota bacterium]|nr:DUF3616 domain-containing protein [Candidatus Sumerlaeota bacterium]HPS03048.1 DUF3616 domain-containing protein [Candidatus Sumerlaeota bacterium]